MKYINLGPISLNRKEEEKADKHILTQRSLILELLVRFLIICISDEYVNTNNRQQIKKEPYISIGDEDSIFKYLLFRLLWTKDNSKNIILLHI